MTTPLLSFPATLHYRYLAERDLPHVLRIERSSDKEELWDEREFRRHIGKQPSRGVMVARDPNGDKVCGYLAYELYDDAYVFKNLVVERSLRRQHVGTALVVNFVAKRLVGPVTTVQTVVREHDVVVQLFWKHCKFLWVATVPHFFDAPVDDGYVFQFDVPATIKAGDTDAAE